jgi:hypothetical protein
VLYWVTDDGTGLILGEEEGKAMKRHGLGGLLLGVTVLLLFTAGVALAEGPVCDEAVSVLGEDFGDGWSLHWTDGDNASGLQYT